MSHDVSRFATGELAIGPSAGVRQRQVILNGPRCRSSRPRSTGRSLPPDPVGRCSSPRPDCWGGSLRRCSMPRNTSAIRSRRKPGPWRSRTRAGSCRCALLLVLVVPAVVRAEDAASPASDHTHYTEEIQVTGHYENAVGSSDAASAGRITRQLVEDRPILRPGEVLELVPGLIITQHSGAGKANQYFLRGFNLDHGTDFLTTLDGMPVNLRTHAHGQGYTDLNFLIPELIQRVDYFKGPYFASKGDFASAGAADIHYAASLPHNLVELTGGSFLYGRGLVAGSPELGGGKLLYGLEIFHNDGPWDHPDDYRRLNGVLRY